MIIQQLNFEDLLTSYYVNDSAHEAAEHLLDMLLNKHHQQIATILRSHENREITSAKEIRLRDALDRLLHCYSIMEIASLTEFIPNAEQTIFGATMRPILEDKYVRLYYEEYYPVKLPQLFRHRLAGTNHAIEAIPPSNHTSNFMTFLALDDSFRKNLSGGYFLKMLDSFRVDGSRFSDMVNIIGEPNKFVNYLLVAPEDRDALSWALHEFRLFMEFCLKLRELLLKVEKQSLLQSAIWNH